MKKSILSIFLFVFFTLFWGSLSAQKMTVVKFETLENDILARTQLKKDINGEPCAILRVVIPLEGLDIRGNMGRIGDVISKYASEYVVYLPAGTRKVLINCPEFPPFQYEVGYKLEGKKVYCLVLNVEDAVVAVKSPLLGEPTSGKKYKIGDYFHENGKQGIVFEVDKSGRHGKILSVEEGFQPWVSKRFEEELNKEIDATDKNNGMQNLSLIKGIDGWKSKYPAFVWCESLGEGWYLPSISELVNILKNSNKINKTLHQYSATPISIAGTPDGGWSNLKIDIPPCYLSSSVSENMPLLVMKMKMVGCMQIKSPGKGYSFNVRAVATF